MSNLSMEAGVVGRLMGKIKISRLALMAAVLFLFSLAFVNAESFVGMGLSSGDAWAEEAAPATDEAGAEGEAAAEGEAVDDGIWKPGPPPKLEAKDYPVAAGISGRLAVWFAAQMHLFFAAFVLGVPIFVWVIELIGVLSGDKRYDHMAHEFMKVSMTGFSLAASFGGLLSILLVVYYPDFMEYMVSIFGKVMIIYALMFFAESFFVYTYYYGWDRLSATPGGKWLHLGLGLGLNSSGMVLMVLSNSWASFMMAPSGIGPEGAFLGDSWAAIHGKLWNPLNLHRFIANIAYGGSLTAAYAAYKFITTKSEEERAHYDWMGYTSFIIAMAGLLPLPFAGYWLTKEVYDYSQQMGITLMGGVFAWLFILQAVLIGAIFLSANYYLWCSLGRTEASRRFYYLIQPMGIIIVISFLTWFTPHTLIMTSKELSQIGGAHHSVLGPLGVMAAKNTAVNLLILATFMSFQLFMRSNHEPAGDGFFQKNGLSIQVALFAAAIVNIVFLGVYSYYIPANIRIGLSIPQVTTTAIVCVLGTIVQTLEFKGAKEIGVFRWGHMPGRSQYALFMLAVSFTWLMGLMGYCRSAIRQHWHVYTVFRDNSIDAYTPTLPYAAWVVTIIVMVFMALVFFMFWMPMLAAKKKEEHEAGH